MTTKRVLRALSTAQPRFRQRFGAAVVLLVAALLAIAPGGAYAAGGDTEADRFVTADPASVTSADLGLAGAELIRVRGAQVGTVQQGSGVSGVVTATHPDEDGDPDTLTVTVEDGTIVTGIAVFNSNDASVYDGPFQGPATFGPFYAPERANNPHPPVTAWLVCGSNGPDCSAVTASPNVLKADGKLQQVTLSGAGDNDAVSYSITAVTQDEPTSGGWRQDLKTPDAASLHSNQVSLRGERNPSLNGRVYRIAYTVTDAFGLSCSGIAKVGVPLRKGHAPVDDGDQASWNSFTGALVE